MRCTCEYCRDIDYDNSEYFVDRSHLNRPRPVGVTGLLRVKNDAGFLALCIDSCIEALDELVIVYQPCDDDSPRIIESKRRQYPDKIRTYFYRPVVVSHHLTEEEFRYASALPETSIHLLSNYYNYALSKASYRYALKIDADQIYFTDKLKAFCDAFRMTEKKRITFMENVAARQIHFFADLTNVFPELLSRRFRFLIPSDKQVTRYSRYTLKKAANKKYPVSFSGINLYERSGEWMLPTGGYADGLFPPFNGIHDTYIFKISPMSYYTPQPIPYHSADKYRNCIIEHFSLNQTLIIYKSIYSHKLLYGGFLWYHTAPLKEPDFTAKREKYANRTLPLFGKRNDFFSLENHSPLRRWMRPWYCLFWRREQRSLPERSLPEIGRILHTRSNDEKQ